MTSFQPVALRHFPATMAGVLIVLMHLALPALADPLLPPSGVTAQALAGPQVLVQWQSQPAADGYRVLRATTPGGPYSPVADSVRGGSFTDTAVAPATTYHYVVQTIDQARFSKNSTEATVTTGPATPQNVRPTASTNRVDLTWDAAGGAVRYEVIDVGATRDQELVRGSTTATTFSDSAVSPDAWYYYKVRAIAANGATEDSGVLPVHTGAPTKTRITVNPTEAGQSVLLTAKVTQVTAQAEPYMGRVDFYLDGGLAGWVDNLSDADHTAQEWFLSLPEGEHVIYAHFYGSDPQGSPGLGASTSALKIHVVQPAYGQVNLHSTTLYRFGDGFNPSSVALADVSGDRRLDALATTGMHTGSPDDFRLLPLHQQAQPGQALAFQPSLATHGAWLSTMRVDTGDIDGDGDTDAAVMVHGGVDVFRQSAGRLARRVFISTGTTDAWLFRDVRVQDMDGDRRADLIIQAGRRVEVRRSLGGGRFAAPVLVARAARYVEVGNFDGDADPDIVTWAGEDIYAYRQTANHAYKPAFHRTVPGSRYHPATAVAIGDVTGDRRNDLVASTTGNIPNSHVVVYRRTTTGFASPVVYPVRDTARSIVLSDVNEDGRKDVVVAHGQWNEVGIMLQRPDGVLGREQRQDIPVKLSTELRGLAVGDLTGDNNRDIAVIAPLGLVVLATS